MLLPHRGLALQLRMTDTWLGCSVSLECRSDSSTDVYQGRILAVDSGAHTLTLSNVYRNGRPFHKTSLTLRASDIQNLRFVSPGRVEPPAASAAEHGNFATTCAPSADGRASKDSRNAATKCNSKKLPRQRSQSCSGTETDVTLAMPGRQAAAGSSGKRQECFAVPVDSCIDEFDFEKNLALFDKEQVFSQIENELGQSADIVVGKVDKKYRYDEMILPPAKAVLRQIVIPDSLCGGSDYVTDSGLIVPSVTRAARSAILSAATDAGFAEQQLTDMLGRSACEMVLQLIGGSHRLNPKNDHQRPKVVVFCASHFAGTAGVSCARHLANHSVDVILASVSTSASAPGVLANELELFKKTRGKRLSDLQGLPAVPVDMIVSCIDGHDPRYQADLLQTSWYRAATRWCNDSKANVLTIDPPVEGGAIETKWALGYVLPLNLSSKPSQVYLSDLGIPCRVFETVGVKYATPFGSKFCIPLHNA